MNVYFYTLILIRCKLQLGQVVVRHLKQIINILHVFYHCFNTCVLNNISCFKVIMLFRFIALFVKLIFYHFMYAWIYLVFVITFLHTCFKRNFFNSFYICLSDKKCNESINHCK